MLFFSPAKINLFLHVIGRREDGFHALCTQIQAVSLFDQLEISADVQDSFTLNVSHIPHDDKNLVLRALHLFRKKTGIKQPFKIHLEKNIPTEAGLGGGSGNAATTLWALNHLTNQQISDETLADWGAELGSDVPFFFSHGQALCEGRGEKVTPTHEEFSSWTLIKPHIGLPTKPVFETWASKPELREKSPLNHLEGPAFFLEPSLALMKEELLKSGFSKVWMTGAGSTLVCEGLGIVPWPDLKSFQVRPVFRQAQTWYQMNN